MVASLTRALGVVQRIPNPRLLAPLLVVAYTLKTTLGILGTFDVGLDDETIYLDGARYLGIHFLPLAESSPLYPRWYRLLTIFEPDPLHLYFLNWLVLTTSLPLVLYALARRSGAPLWAASVAAMAWAGSSSILSWPHVSMFATLVLGVGALATTFTEDARFSGAIAAATLSTAALARAELALPAIAFCAFYIVYALVFALRRKNPCPTRKRALIGAGIAIAAPFALRLLVGSTANPFAHGREFFAFGQHYALNIVESRRLPLDPWTNWFPIAREAFPKAESVAEAARENPHAFLWHVGRNVSNVRFAFEELLTPLPHLGKLLEWMVIVPLGAVLLLGVVGCFRLRGSGSRLLRWIPLAAAVACATAASMVLIYPRPHYALALCYLLVAALAGACGNLHGILPWAPPSSRLVHRGQIALVVALALFLTAAPTRRPGAAPSLLSAAVPPPPQSSRENYAAILALRRLALAGRVVILESDHSRGVYALADYLRIAQGEKDKPFWEFIHSREVNLIVLNERLRRDSRFETDPEFVAFINRTGPLEDFEFLPVEGTSVVLAVRRPLLASGRAR